MQLRPYQRRTNNTVRSNWRNGAKRQVIVCPTGGGKSVMGAELVQSARAANASVLAIAHRRELISQLCDHFGSEAAAICPGFPRRPDAPIQVATIQTLLASGLRPKADMILWDECHHVVSDEWQKLLHDYSGVRVCGLTATPSRADGRALGDIFDQMVVSASYSELIREGFIVPTRVYQATGVMGADLALDPVRAMQKYGRKPAFVFCRDIPHCYEVSANLNGEQISAAVISHKTKPAIREAEIGRFKRGWLDALVNVNTLTEGIDIKCAQTCIIATSVSHPSRYLQMVGRIMRPDTDKADGILIDLTGVSLLHGLPHEDREYSLCGKPINKTSADSLRVCLNCGYTYYSHGGSCPSCGFTWSPPKKNIKIYSQELREVFAGIDTPSEAKYVELKRLVSHVVQKNWNLEWALKQYKKLFLEAAPAWRIPIEVRMKWFDRLASEGKSRKYNHKYPYARYHAAFGCWPEWR